MNAPAKARRSPNTSPLGAGAAADALVQLNVGIKMAAEEAATKARNRVLKGLYAKEQAILARVPTDLVTHVGELVEMMMQRRQEAAVPDQHFAEAEAEAEYDQDAKDIPPALMAPKPEEPPGARIETEERPRRQRGQRGRRG